MSYIQYGSHHIQTCVLGGGVIGLAVARALAMKGHEVMILEKENKFGTGTSSRNSEVIHAGIYYPNDSLKAKLCVKGKKMLYDYCQVRCIDHSQIGKLIVATDENQMKNQIPQILQQAEKNNVLDLVLLSSEDVKAYYEPQVTCYGAIFSPSTGVIDSHSLMLSLLSDAQDNGAILVTNSKVENVSSNLSKNIGNITVQSQGIELICDNVINATGLFAGEVAKWVYQSIQSSPIPCRTLHTRQYFAKGNYYQLQGKNPFSHLIYPVPSSGGLGVHATVDLTNAVRFGPDVEWIHPDKEIEDIDYEVDAKRATLFYDEVRKYWPFLQDDSLQTDYAGIRPKLGHPGIPNSNIYSDFLIHDESVHGVTGFVNLMGIESPGLTSSLAIAEAIETILCKSG